MNPVHEILIGLAVGCHIATWGMYKDAIHEGFTLAKYVRSILVGVVLAPLGAALAHLDATTASGMFMLFGLTYALERAVTEFWKTFIRDEDQSKYFIPMQFHVMGRVVRSRSIRFLVGLGLVGVATLLLKGAHLLQPEPGATASPWSLALVASVGGWYSALGGAFKDAPIEGFETFKFFRSPLVALAYGLLVSIFTPSYPLIALCAIGFTVATLETYKTFFFPSVPRGKFAGKPILFPGMLARRKYFVPLYALIWAGLILTAVTALTGSPS